MSRTRCAAQPRPVAGGAARGADPCARRPAGRVASLAAALALGLAAAARAGCADVALVLAIDASGSIRAEEYALQQAGYVRAFRSPRVQAALAAAGVVDVGVVIWGDSEMTPQILPLRRLVEPADAAALADRIEAMPRRVSGNTGLGRGVSVSLDLLEGPGACAARRIVNVSGDGLETIAPRPRFHVPLAEARARAEAMGVTINALAIETDVADLGDWYRQRLIAGPDAFVMRVDGFGTFADAIEEKLLREIAPAAFAALDPGP